VVAADEEEDQGPPILASGTATLVFEQGQATAAYDLTAVGPLVPLQTIVGRLGGELEVGPLEQRHALSVGEITALFGPGATTLTIGEEISTLSQPPRLGVAGLHVPLDLLEITYGEQLGFRFSWEPDSATLTLSRTVAQEIPIRSEVVHLQGVTTIVLTFGEQPRFRVHELDNGFYVEVLDDRLQPFETAAPPAQSFVQEVAISERGIRVQHAPDVVSQSYELDNPYRLVFDLFRGTAPASPRRSESRPAGPRLPQRARDLPGIHTIVIDPGHGGGNSGAISRSGVAEKEITLPIAQSLKEALERAMPVRVLLTRDGDDELDLDERSAIANQNKADLFISLHVNSSFGRTAHGAETFFLSLQASDEMAAEIAAIENEANSGGTADDPLTDLDLILWDLAQSYHLAESQRYARLIQEELNGALGLADRGVKQAPFRVLRGAAMPAVLVELGFLSNPGEEERLQDPEYRTQLVDSLVRATQRYRALVEGHASP
jgi:N-acetylmuramoyl-L-alanine amidase